LDFWTGARGAKGKGGQLPLLRVSKSGAFQQRKSFKERLKHCPILAMDIRTSGLVF
jgi:hypothetical protein